MEEQHLKTRLKFVDDPWTTYFYILSIEMIRTVRLAAIDEPTMLFSRAGILSRIFLPLY